MVKVDIPGIGEVTAENAASERTLREILKALGGKTPTGQTGGGASGAGPDLEKVNKNTKKFNKEIKEAGTEVDAFGSKLSSITGGVLNALVAGVGAVVGALPGFATELAFGGQQLTDFAKHIPIPGLTALTGLLDGQINSFRQLTQTGASFGNSMFEITRIAGEAAIPQQQFIELVSQQGEGLRIFGNSVGDGARRFASLSKELRQSPLGTRLREIGFTSEELNENFINYSELMQTSGRRQFMTDKQLIEGSLKYSQELDKISKLTGKSRKQMEEEMRQKNLDIRRQMAINKYGEEFGLRLQQISATSPKLEAAILDMADGVANDPLTKQLMANNATFREQARNVHNMTAEQANNFMKNVRDDGLAFARTMGDAGVQASIAAGNSVGAYNELTGELGRVQKTTNDVTAEEQAKRDKITEKMGTFAETVATIQGNIQAAIVDSGIFQDLSDKIADFLPTTEEAKTMYADASKYFKDKILPSLQGVYDWFMGDGMTGMTEGIGGMFTYAKDTLWPKIKEMFTYLTDLWDGLTPKIDAFFAEGGTFDNMMASFTSLYEEYEPKVKTFFETLFSEGGIQKIYDQYLKPTIMSAFDSLLSGIGFVAIGGAITLMLVKAIGAINPWVKIATLLVGGIAAVIGWDNIKGFFTDTIPKFGSKISEKFSEVLGFITGIFSWTSIKGYIGNILPDGKIGDWVRGKLGIGDSGEAPMQTTSNPTVEEAVSESATASEANALASELGATPTNSDGSSWWETISNKLTELIDVNKGTQKATKQLNGNINGAR